MEKFGGRHVGVWCTSFFCPIQSQARLWQVGECLLLHQAPHLGFDDKLSALVTGRVSKSGMRGISSPPVSGVMIDAPTTVA